MKPALILSLAGCFLACSSETSMARTGWLRPIDSYTDKDRGQVPKINLPKSTFEKMMDLQTSDGTIDVQPCSDPDVIATVRDGILEVLNRQASRITGKEDRLVTKADLGEVWVHPTFSGRVVCRMKVQVDLPFTGAEEYEFETIARDGKRYVAFYGNQ